MSNISAESGASPFTISQQVRLKPDSYTLDANFPWIWNDVDSVSAVTLTVTEAEAKAGSGFPVTLSIKPGGRSQLLRQIYGDGGNPWWR